MRRFRELVFVIVLLCSVDVYAAEKSSQEPNVPKPNVQEPNLIKLNHADPEYMADKLNTLFSEPGTISTIRLEDRGVVNYSMDVKSRQPVTDSGESSNHRYQPWWGNKDSKPWWITDSNIPAKEMRSGLIGRVRFIPYMRKNSILALVPSDDMPKILSIIKKLDTPSPQLMIKVVVLSIEHADLSSIGVRLADEAYLSHGKVSDSEILTLSQFGFLKESGNVTIAASTGISALVDLLVKHVNARVLNEQTLWTKDHEAASFFKGEVVGFLTQSNVTGTGLAQGTTEFLDVGMMVMVRPSITMPEDSKQNANVDMEILVELQNTTDSLVNTQPVRNKTKTMTSMTVEDGQTLMLGGILFQKDREVKRKLPILGDIPLLGFLFRSKEKALVNEELIVLITPRVVNTPSKGKEMQKEQLEKVEEIQTSMDQKMDLIRN